MNLGVRIFLIYFLFVGLTGYFVLSTVMEEIKPGVRQSTEETLVDTANLLAEFLREDMAAGRLNRERFQGIIAAYGQRHPQATIWGIAKTRVDHRIYVTDAKGLVLLDSTGRDLGKDYSRWNDVYRTLRGQYGARTTREDPADEFSTVMYVAAPIQDARRILGVVTVAKPNRALQPFIERSEARLSRIGLALIALSLALGLVFAYALSRSLRRLSDYATAVAQGERAELVLPAGRDEVARLARAIETMRNRLEGKAYVEHYVHGLTHEMKSPLAAIRGAAELIDERMPVEDRERFLANIRGETARLQQLIERLLELARLEHRRRLEEKAPVALSPLIEDWREARLAALHTAGVRLDNALPADLEIPGEAFLLRQALANLLDNALDFTPPGGTIRIHAGEEDGRWHVAVDNPGEPIPDYALPRLFERFYSLPRPATGRKSTGLGLAFVREVASLHGGEVRVVNTEGGVRAELVLPAH
ncbi:MAG: two-component system sensor histidine kinase CreC [Gammaproteobacteria bacterium]|nr:two-component system sensor histidine kinase CreC [Gammaproteobacteria bacterium]